jgi:hypothetical protein
MKALNYFPTLFTFLLLIVICQSQLTAQIRYVKPVSSGLGDGSSWENASDDLQAMINASGVSQVWVAAGTYKPLRDITGNSTPSNSRTKSFRMKNGVSLFGGLTVQKALNQLEIGIVILPY